MARFDSPFVGSEAVVAGAIRKHEQRSRYFAVFPDVYLEKDAVPTLHKRAKAGWLWSHRQGVIAGLTASALHGVKWVDDAAPVELIWPNARPASGLRTYDYRLRTDEFGEVDGMRITTVARAGFDIARRRPLDAAIANLDALGNATGLQTPDILRIAREHRGSRGLLQLGKVLALYDPGAASPKERGCGCW